jgi:hypothetical protein
MDHERVEAQAAYMQGIFVGMILSGPDQDWTLALPAADQILEVAL